MEIGAKVFSSMMSKRLFKRMKLPECPTQFGSSPGVGCQDGRFVIKTALQTRHKQNLPTYVVFFDLVKVFDTVSHRIMLKSWSDMVHHPNSAPPSRGCTLT